MQDRKSEILSAGLQVLREEGFGGFTQPRIAARAGLRQSHLTYYFPTRVDLLAAVARIAIDSQFDAFDQILDGQTGSDVVVAMAWVLAQHQNTRVLMGLAQAADQEPALQALFRELTSGLLERIGRLLEMLGVADTPANRDVVHALTVGLSVIDLATSRSDGQDRTQAALEATLGLLPTAAA
jgi:AcrR family transcriptional regulator